MHAYFSNRLQIIVSILAIQITFLEYEFDLNKLDSTVMNTHKGILDFIFALFQSLECESFTYSIYRIGSMKYIAIIIFFFSFRIEMYPNYKKVKKK